MNEYPICKDFVSQLNFYERINRLQGFFFHVPNQISRNNNFKYGKALKAMGKKRGIPDYFFIWKDNFACIEMKKAKGPVSKEQKEFEQMCNDFNFKHAICKSSDEAIEKLKEWKFITQYPIIKN